MNFFQGLNAGFFVATMAALLSGLSKVPLAVSEYPATLWLFLAFFFMLRLKMCFDDHQYFDKPYTKNVNFKIGLITGLVSWLFWGMGAWAIKDLTNAYFSVGVAITVSTLWVVAVAIRGRRAGGVYRQQYIWLATNALYVLLLWIAARRNQPVGDWATWTVLSIALAIVVIDLVFSRSVPEFDQ